MAHSIEGNLGDADMGSMKCERKPCACILSQGGDIDVVMHDASCAFLLECSSEDSSTEIEIVEQETVECADETPSPSAKEELDRRIEVLHRRNSGAAIPHDSTRLVKTSYKVQTQHHRTTAVSGQGEHLTVTIHNQCADETPSPSAKEELDRRIEVLHRRNSGAAIPHDSTRLVKTSYKVQTQHHRTTAVSGQGEHLTVTIHNQDVPSMVKGSRADSSCPKSRRVEDRLNYRLEKECESTGDELKQPMTVMICTINDREESIGYSTDLCDTSDAERREYWKKRHNHSRERDLTSTPK